MMTLEMWRDSDRGLEDRAASERLHPDLDEECSESRKIIADPKIFQTKTQGVDKNSYSASTMKRKHELCIVCSVNI